MGTVTQVGHAGLQGWREKVADGIAPPLSKRAPVDEDQVRVAVGVIFFVLSVMYVFKTVSAVAREARGS